MRRVVVVCNRNEVQSARGRSLNGNECGTWHRLARLVGASPITVRGVHVEIAAIPTGSIAQWYAQNCRLIRNETCAGKEDVCLKVRDNGTSNIGDTDQQLPLAGQNRPGQTRRCCVRLTDCERRFIASAPATQLPCIFDAEIESRMLIAASVGKGKRNATHARWDFEWHLDVTVVLLSPNVALQNNVCFIRACGYRFLRYGQQATWRHCKEK